MEIRSLPDDSKLNLAVKLCWTIYLNGYPSQRRNAGGMGGGMSCGMGGMSCSMSCGMGGMSCSMSCGMGGMGGMSRIFIMV